MKCIKEGCKANTIKGSEYCYFHDPKIAEKRKEGQANGGRRGRGFDRKSFTGGQGVAFGVVWVS